MTGNFLNLNIEFQFFQTWGDAARVEFQEAATILDMRNRSRMLVRIRDLTPVTRATGRSLFATTAYSDHQTQLEYATLSRLPCGRGLRWNARNSTCPTQLIDDARACCCGFFDTQSLR